MVLQSESSESREDTNHTSPSDPRCSGTHHQRQHPRQRSLHFPPDAHKKRGGGSVRRMRNRSLKGDVQRETDQQTRQCQGQWTWRCSQTGTGSSSSPILSHKKRRGKRIIRERNLVGEYVVVVVGHTTGQVLELGVLEDGLLVTLQQN